MPPDIRQLGDMSGSLLVQALRHAVAFDAFAFSGIDIEGYRAGKGIFLINTLPQQFTAQYVSEGYWSIDPMVAQVSPTRPLATWEDIEDLRILQAESRPLCAALNTYDIAPRTAISLWNGDRMYGSATFTRERPFSDHEIETLHAFVPAVHSTLSKPVIAALNAGLGLTPGELTCLRWAAHGLTSEDIAREDRFTVETVNSYLKSATKKLKARNRSHAIAEAIRRKIII